VRPARNEDHIVAVPGEPRAEESADRACAKDGDPHAAPS